MQITRLIHAACFGYLILSHCYPVELHAQSKSQNPVAASIECAIEVETETWSIGNPVLVTVKIRNVSDKGLDLVGACDFQLTKDGDARPTSYWSPVNILDGTPPQGIVGKVTQSALHLGPRETKAMKFDVTKFFWSKSIYSQWPYQGLFVAVPKGNYDLIFDIATDRRRNSKRIPIVSHIASNKVSIVVR